MRETWYVLEDGTAVDPNEVTQDEKGALMHKSGKPVAIGPHGPKSRGVDPDEERAKPKTKDMEADDKPKTYRTRESKGR